MRAPDFIIGAPDAPYMLRWWVIPRNRWLNIYLHHILRDDEDRALHDHPWVNVSIVLRGGYWEHMPKGIKWRGPGSVVARLPKSAHRLALPRRLDATAWTLFITGPRIREWGFYCPQGWKHWKAFTKAGEPGQIGPGCDDGASA